MKIQIIDQGRTFVNEVLHSRVGIDECIALMYHPQSNELCEWQNRTIKKLVEILDGNPCDWPNKME